MPEDDMAKMMKVLRVELKETTTEAVVRHKRHDYVRGGYRIEETIKRETSAIPHALLECGHWREEIGTGTSVSKAAKLSCWQCERDEREASNVQIEALPASGQSLSNAGLGSAKGENGNDKEKS